MQGGKAARVYGGNGGGGRIGVYMYNKRVKV